MATGQSVVSTGGIELHLTNAQGTLTKIPGVMTVNRPDLEFGEADITDQDSGGIEDFDVGMGKVNDLVAKIKYVPGGEAETLIEEHKASKEKRPFKIVEVKADGTKREGTASLFIKSFKPDDGATGNTRMATLTARPGPLTLADAAA